MDRIAYVNGEYLPLADATIPVLDRGFLFADGIYEVSAVIDARIVDGASHMARLERSAGEIGLALREPMERIEAIQRELIRRNGLVEGLVYLQATRGPADRDFLPAPDLTPTLVMFTQAKTLIDTPTARAGIRIVTMEDIRWARRDIKSVMLLAQVLAKQAAADAGAQEAWMLEDGFVTEGASSTAWIITADGRLVTRGQSHATLPGCTGLAVARLAVETGITIEERPFALEEAMAAREAFITSATTFVMPVVQIDDQPIGGGIPGPIAARLRELYIAFARGRSPEPASS